MDGFEETSLCMAQEEPGSSAKAGEAEPSHPTAGTPASFDQLNACLRDYFAVEDESFIRFMGENSSIMELYAGDVLIEQGARDDDVYFVLSGRLRAIRIEADGSRLTLGEIGRGEPVGELAMFTAAPRSSRSVIRCSRGFRAKPLKRRSPASQRSRWS